MNNIKYIILFILFLKLNFINSLSKKDFIFYSIVSDERDCPYPQCGGYWLRRINTKQSPFYVASISLDPSIINFNISLITLALTNDLILGGLILSYPKFKYFQVYNATRLIYNNGAEKLYGQSIYNREYQYITITQNKANVALILDSKKNDPFIPYIAESINLSFQFKLLSFNEMYSKSINYIDKNWLTNQIINSKTINYGFIDQKTNSFSIVKIFIEIPLGGDYEKCNEKKINNFYSNKINNDINNIYNDYNETICDTIPNTIATFQRDNSKCILFSGCVINNSTEYENCDYQNIMKCPQGYTLTFIRVKPYGCKKYYCDVSFLI